MESKYFVWCQTRDLPTRAHSDMDSARAESRRLAEANPEVEFMVVRAVESVRYTAFPLRITNYCKG